MKPERGETPLIYRTVGGANIAMQILNSAHRMSSPHELPCSARAKIIFTGHYDEDSTKNRIVVVYNIPQT